MKKLVYIDNIDLKIAKQISNILLGLPEIDSLDIQIDDKIITIYLNSRLSNSILKNFLKSSTFNILNIEEIQ